MEPRKPTTGHDGSRFVEIAKEQEEYLTLPAYIDQAGLIQTEWVPSEGERIALANGAPIRLWLYTFGRPMQPVRLEIGNPESAPCKGCDGCGQVADSDDGEPWTCWEELPPGSDLAVRAGLVKPIPCPACDGKGVR